MLTHSSAVASAQLLGAAVQPTTCFTKSTTTHGPKCSTVTGCLTPACVLLSTIHLSCGCTTIGTKTTYTPCRTTCTASCGTVYSTIYSPCPTPAGEPTPTIITASRSVIGGRDAQGFGEPSRTVIWDRDAKAQGFGEPSRTVIWDRDAKAQGFGEPSRTAIWDRAAKAQNLGDPSRTIIWDREAEPQVLGDPTQIVEDPPVTTRAPVFDRAA